MLESRLERENRPMLILVGGGGRGEVIAIKHPDSLLLNPDEQFD
jgi:hypothetical protein